MRIVTWNMGHWQHRAQSAKAWSYLESLNPDIILTQESVLPPEGSLFRHHHVWNNTEGEHWGVGVFSREIELVEEQQLKNINRGLFSVANGNIGGRPIAFVSLYGRIEREGPAKGYAVTTLHRLLSDLTSLLDGLLGNKEIILAGDLNASTQLDPEQGNRSHELFFERLMNFNIRLVDCIAQKHSAHVQTPQQQALAE